MNAEEYLEKRKFRSQIPVTIHPNGKLEYVPSVEVIVNIHQALEAVRLARADCKNEVLEIVSRLIDEYDNKTNKGSNTQRNYFAEKYNTTLTVWDRIDKLMEIEPLQRNTNPAQDKSESGRRNND